MIGTTLNVAGILAGGAIGLVRRTPLSAHNQAFFKVALGAFTVFYGLRLTWLNLEGSLLQILKQLLIAILALMIGKLIGRLLRLQQMSNALGRDARDQIAAAAGTRSGSVSEGFKTCAALFCAAPLGVLGALQDGLSEYYYTLAVKAFMEGLATMAFVGIFGWGVMLAALPVLAIQGSITLAAAQYLRPLLLAHDLIAPVNVVGGFIVFSVALIILDLKKIEIADYLPSLAVAPLLTGLVR